MLQNRQLSIFAKLVLFVFAACNITPVHAASIRYDGYNIFISGKIKSGDLDKFKELVASIERPRLVIDGVIKRSQFPSRAKPKVYLRSGGGNTVEALLIGEFIRKKRYTTYAYKGNCQSACGLVWLGGAERIIHPKARVGFHNSYHHETRRAEGNALVGMYMAYLGYRYPAVQFVTRANYKNINYLSPKNSKKYGISYSVRRLPSKPERLRRVSVPKPDPRKASLVAKSNGEPAFLYMRSDGNSSTTRANATVTWSAMQASPLTGFAKETVITASMNVPENRCRLNCICPGTSTMHCLLAISLT